jgi:hypothetical protein
MNGDFITKEGFNTGKSCLIFEKGSNLYAEKIYIQTCNNSLIPVMTADNGGFVFLDSLSTEEKKDTINTKNTKNSIINAKFIFGVCLDNTNKSSLINDFNDISIDKVNNKLNLKNIYSKYVMDEGFDVEF